MEIRKFAFYILSPLLSALLIALLVFAYGGSSPSTHGHSSGEIEIQSGFIAPFDASSCPSGWSQVAAGKVIVGLNTGDVDFATPGNTGGAKTVTLNTNQIPSHSHNAYYRTVSGNMGGDSRDLVRPYSSSGSGSYSTSSTGSGAAHNNMPPYVAYIYCEKN